MLVLTRKADEAVWIGDDVRIVVVRLHGGQVKLGIEAPTERAVLREEIKLAREAGGGQGTPTVGTDAPPLFFLPPGVAEAALGESSFNN